MLKLNFCTPVEFDNGINRLCEILDIERGDGITVTACKGDRIGVSVDDKKAIIYYKEKYHFWRELGLAVQYAKKGESVDINEDGYFTSIGAMVDTSRCAVPKVKTVFKMIDYLAVMGYNMVMLYTEDMIKLESYKYFGYMRGRYSQDEIRAIDDYAYEYGIEVVPCIECLGHMEKYMFWPESAPIRDTPSVLLAREKKTFEFLEEYIKTISSCVRSKRIHLGMDECQSLGKGNFRKKHSEVSQTEIFNEYMNNLISITDKYGLEPMIWSDMYFRIHDPEHWYYYEETKVSDETRESIPKNVELVFWHYGEEPRCDEYMLKKHIDLGCQTMFAGATWSWIGHFPEHDYMMETLGYSMNACRTTGVKEALNCIWFNDNAECELFTNLFGCSYFAELAYNAEVTKEDAKIRFEACTGGDYNSFYNMCRYQDMPHSEISTKKNFQERFRGKALFWQDILEGLYDTHLFEKPMSEHYAFYAKEFEKSPNDCWSYLYAYAKEVFEYLAIKCEIAENLVPAYKSNDKQKLTYIADELLPKLKKLTANVHKTHRNIWIDECKELGWGNLDIRYAGVEARCETAILRLKQYLNGEVDSLEELEDRLHKNLSGFVRYCSISSPNLRT